MATRFFCDSQDAISGALGVYRDRLEFSGTGTRRFRFGHYVVSRDDVERVCDVREVADPWYRRFFVSSVPGVRVIGRPGGSFGERDDYLIQFINPPVSEALGVLNGAGYPVGGLGEAPLASVHGTCLIRIMAGSSARSVGPCELGVYADCLRFYAFAIGTAKNWLRLQRERVEVVYHWRYRVSCV